MAFNNSPGRAEYTATAGQTVFTYVFKAYNDTDIKVYLTPAGQVADDAADLLTLTTDYTVVISGDVGGTITLVVPASNGDSITLVRTLEIDRQIEYQTSGDLLADTLNQDQNYQTYLIADKESDNTRFLKLQESAQGVSTEIPSPVPLNFFQWNAAGDAIINVDSLQADGFLWTAADVYTKPEVNTLLDAKVDITTLDENAKLWDAQTVTHDFTTDADYTLTAAQNAYGRIVCTDTGVVLTTGRNVITDNVEKSFIVQNDTLQILTFKTPAGTGIAVRPGATVSLYNDGTNVINALGLESGVTYVDPDAVGANPTAKIYPDGTVVGSTDNGNYIKYPNGELEMYGMDYSVPSITTANGNIFGGAVITITLPIASTIVVACSSQDNTNASGSWGQTKGGTTSIDIKPYAYLSIATARSWSAQAKGKWK